MPRALAYKTILITGGAGFIGSHLARACLWEGANVSVLVLPGSRLWRIEDIKEEIRIWEGSVTDSAYVNDVIQRIRPDIVFHLAALIERTRSFEAFPKLYDVHVHGTKNLIEALKKVSGLERFVHVGTIEEYGSGKAPFKEGQREMPVSLYSLTKMMATKLVEYTAHEEGFPALIVRPSLIYGPYQGFGMLIPDAIRACLEGRDFPMTKGEQTRDFLFVEDLVEALARASCAPGAEGIIVNLGSGTEKKVREVVETVKRIAGGPGSIQFGALPYKAGENMHFWLDSSRAAMVLGWKARTQLHEGLARTVAWYKENYQKI